MNQCFIRVNHKNKRLRAFQRRLHEESEGQGEGRKGPHTRLPRSQASPNRGGCSSWPLSVFPFKDPRHYYSLREDGAAESPHRKNCPQPSQSSTKLFSPERGRKLPPCKPRPFTEGMAHAQRLSRKPAPWNTPRPPRLAPPLR